MTKPEVLAPAGSPDCLPAAVAGGADAVYLGLRHFNARGRAENFRTAELAHHVAYLHRHGLKAYVVFNTLVHDDEYPKALTLARAACEAGVDAAIIQDLGLWTVLAREVPGLKRHASTQMTVHDPAQIAVLADLGAERVILARELALDEVRACTVAAQACGIETEHFVHGALCYAFSGQCLMSNFAGCRSANRGTCAQNCRFDYRSEGADRDVTELSMRDFALIGRIGDLADAGVASLKIEGRLKTPEYVYTVSSAYRAAVDAWAAGEHLDQDALTRRLREVFARPFTAAPLEGVYDARSRLDRWQGEDTAADAWLLNLDRERGRAEIRADVVRSGMGFTYTHQAWNGGFLVTAADPAGPGRWRCRIRGDAKGPPLPDGIALRRNVDHARRDEAREAMAAVPLGEAPPPAVAVDLRVAGGIGEALTVHGRSADGREATVRSAEVLQAARGDGLDAERLGGSLAAFGGTAFRLGRLDLALDAGAFLPAKVLKQVRRDLVAALDAQPAREVTVAAAPIPDPGTPRRRRAALWVAVDSREAARIARDAGAERIWLDDPALDLWDATAPLIDSAGFAAGQLWLRHPATAPCSPHLTAIGLPVVAGQIGVIRAARVAGLRVCADVFTNVFGWATLQALAQLGAEAAVMSLECSAREVARCLARLGADDPMQVGIVVHGRLPAMLTRQDHGLAIGASRRIQAAEHDGGLPYRIQRRRRDTVIWESRQLCVPETVATTRDLVDGWVVEAGGLGPEALTATIRAYADLRDGSLDADGLRARLEGFAPDGFFPGHLVRGSRELDEVVGRIED